MNRLAGLDGLRGIAALSVVGYHAGIVFGGFEVFDRSYLAVDFFFMLSGYVMARTYEQAFGEGLTPARFVWKRYLRLWPPMAVGAILGLAVFMLRDKPLGSSLAIFATTFLMMPNPIFRPFFTNSPAWSIFFELFANGLHAMLLWRVRMRFLLALALASLVLLAVWSTGNISLGHNPETFIGGFARVLLPYCIGIALWRTNLRHDQPAWLAYPALAAGLLFLPVGVAADFAFVCLVCPLVIIFGTGKGSRACAAALGKLSFPLYAVHFPALRLGNEAGLGAWPSIGTALAIAALISVTLEHREARARRPVVHSGELSDLPLVGRH